MKALKFERDWHWGWETGGTQGLEVERGLDLVPGEPLCRVSFAAGYATASTLALIAEETITEQLAQGRA